MKRREQFHDDSAGGGVSSATREDLAFAVRRLGEAEQARAEAAVALARVRVRGDGEAAVGMPVEQHLRWNTALRRGTVTTLGVVTDVAPELPTVMAALQAGTISFDQAAAVAWPASRVSRALRRSLDLSLATDGDGWTRLSPESLEYEVSRLLEELTPAKTEQQELEAAQRQWLHLQPTLDGQGLRGNFQAWGPDAALLNEAIHTASDTPVEDVPAADGTIVRPTRRAGQLFDGLLRIVRGWAGSAGGTGGGAVPAVTLYALVDERDDATGTGEILTTRRGLAPRLSAAAVRALEAAGARRVEVFTVERDIVAVAGRAGHAIDDPDALSEDTTRILCRIRDNTCRMPGCDRPASHLHHLIWRGLARARGQVAPDDPHHRAFLCEPCHQLVHRWRWAGTVGALGRITWTRAGPTGRVTTSTVGRLARRLRPPPIPTVDQFGDPLPF